jgi:hypothetical protein
MLLASSKGFGQQVYAMEFNQSNNQFGTINLVSGVFDPLGSEGTLLFNDIAEAPSGVLYGIVNSASLVTLNPANGAVLTTVSFSASSIESLAFAPNGTLYGATQGALYTVNPTNGVSTLVGSFNNSVLGNSGQNIRFAANGQLYDTDGGMDANNTHLFDISLTTGQATLVGVVTNFPGLCLENAGADMYGVGIQLGSASTLVQSLVGIDLNTGVPGGTNQNGSTVDLGYDLLTSDFPNNYNFSSDVSFDVPGPPSATPEPGSAVLCLTGGFLVLGISIMRRR